MEIATYEEIKDLPNHPEILLIDVREAAEILDAGRIPTSINIPLNVLVRELRLSDQEFRAKYRRLKPTANTTVIFSCRSGVRAQRGTEYARKMGFKNAKTYKGSWADWARKEGIP